jgi:hypothetical protein
MSDMPIYQITQATAQRKPSGGHHICVRLPREPTPAEDGRLAADPEYGLSVLKKLAQGFDLVNLADADHPARLPSAGILVLTSDKYGLFHRRDKFAPTHKLWTSVPTGFPTWSEISALITGNDITYPYRTAARELAEEKIILSAKVPANKPTDILLPHGPWFDYIAEVMNQTGKKLDYPLHPEVMPETNRVLGTDTLQILDANDRQLSFSVCSFVPNYESEISFNALYAMQLNLRAGQIIPLDMEGNEKDGVFNRFNREAMLLNLKTVGLPGTTLDDALVFQYNKERGVYSEPPKPLAGPAAAYLGPDKIAVKHPYVFIPDELAVRMLDAVGAKAYAGRWMQIERAKLEAVVRGASLIPEALLVR